MTFWKRLQNPVALAGQGFILGAILFFATPDTAPTPAPETGSILSTLETSL